MWAAALTSGRAAWIWLWMANAAVFTGQSPSTTLPSWSTRMRSRARIRPKLMPNGLTQNSSGCSGSRPGQVAGDALVEPEPVEQPEGRGHPLLHVRALLVGRREGGEVVGTAVRHGALRSVGSCSNSTTGPPGRSSSHRARSSASGSSSTAGRAVEDARGAAGRGRRRATAARRWRGRRCAPSPPRPPTCGRPAGRVASSRPPSSMSTPPPVEVVEHEGHVDGVAGAEDAAHGGGRPVEPVHRHLGACAPAGPRRAGRRGGGTRGRSSPRRAARRGRRSGRARR